MVWGYRCLFKSIYKKDTGVHKVHENTTVCTQCVMLHSYGCIMAHIMAHITAKT